MSRQPNSTDLLLQELSQALLDGKAHADADMLQSDAHAGEYSAGLDYAMLAFKDLGLSPDTGLIHAVLDSPWCEEDSYADVIGHELLAKAETSIAS